MKLLNLGCGNRYHKDWINLDFKSDVPFIQEFDLTKPLPFANNSIDVIYSSHVLEHFTKCFAPKFLQECFRILKPKGIIRIVVPDLETIVRNYLTFFELSKKGNIEAQEKYDWTMIELFDQMVRNYPGGEMLNYWKQNPMPQEDFIIERVGSEVKNALTIIRQNPNNKYSTIDPKLSSEKVGKFRLSGEIHQWMYDEFSLSRLLQNNQFSDIKTVDAFTSSIPNFQIYGLDLEENNIVRKPDSLFMEAFKQ